MRRRTPGLLAMLIGVSILAATVIAYVAAGRLLAHEVVTAWAGPVTIEAESELGVGASTSITVSADATNGTPLQLAIFAPLDSALLTAPLEQGRAEFTLSPELTRHAGQYRLVAQLGRSESSVHKLQVRAAETVDPVVPLVGPRTIIADGADRTMTVVIPMDRFGNPVADGTVVDIEVLRPAGDRTVTGESVDRGLTAAIVDATTEIGRVTISASVGDVDGPSNAVDQVAGVPAPFTVEADDRNALADGFALHDVQTSVLRDRFGNILPDGVGAVFVTLDGERTSFVQSIVQGGIARARIEAPAEPGQFVIFARVSGAESEPTIFDFAPAVEAFDATWQVTDAAATIKIGPVASARGGYVPDGTIARIREVASGRVVAETALRDGTSQVSIDQVQVALEVEVLGALTRVEGP